MTDAQAQKLETEVIGPAMALLLAGKIPPDGGHMKLREDVLTMATHIGRSFHDCWTHYLEEAVANTHNSEDDVCNVVNIEDDVLFLMSHDNEGLAAHRLDESNLQHTLDKIDRWEQDHGPYKDKFTMVQNIHRYYKESMRDRCPTPGGGAPAPTPVACPWPPGHGGLVPTGMGPMAAALANANRQPPGVRDCVVWEGDVLHLLTPALRGIADPQFDKHVPDEEVEDWGWKTVRFTIPTSYNEAVEAINIWVAEDCEGSPFSVADARGAIDDHYATLEDDKRSIIKVMKDIGDKAMERFHSGQQPPFNQLNTKAIYDALMAEDMQKAEEILAGANGALLLLKVLQDIPPCIIMDLVKHYKQKE